MGNVSSPAFFSLGSTSSSSFVAAAVFFVGFFLSLLLVDFSLVIVTSGPVSALLLCYHGNSPSPLSFLIFFPFLVKARKLKCVSQKCFSLDRFCLLTSFEVLICINLSSSREIGAEMLKLAQAKNVTDRL